MKFLPYGNHFLDKRDLKSVLRSLKKPLLTRGPEVNVFEKNVANKVGARYAVAVSSATAGMHLALKCLNLKPKSLVVTSPITFVSTTNMILHNGLIPFFSDINQEDINLDLNDLFQKTKNLKKLKAIIPVHLSGFASKSKEIWKYAQKKNIFVIEDAAHSFGGSYECGAKVGSCKYSDMTVFSFHPVKTITTLEGGVITTNSKKFYHQLISLRNHGIEKTQKHASWFYEVNNIGFNYRISDVQCALGNSQLRKLDRIIQKRRKIAKFYDKALSTNKGIKIPGKNTRLLSANHLYIVMIDFKKMNLSRTQFCKKMKKKKIGTQLHYIPVPEHKIYKSMGYSLNNLPNSKKYYDTAISIPIYYNLTIKNQMYIVSVLKDIFK